jgi:hypothetical protein
MVCLLRSGKYEVERRCGRLLTVYMRIKLQLDLQADKSSIVTKGPFFPQV